MVGIIAQRTTSNRTIAAVPLLGPFLVDPWYGLISPLSTLDWDNSPNSLLGVPFPFSRNLRLPSPARTKHRDKMAGSDTSEASSNGTEPGFVNRRDPRGAAAAAVMANLPRRRPPVQPPPADLAVDGVAFRNVKQLPLVPLRAVLPTGLQLGLTPNHPMHALTAAAPGSSVQDRLHPPGLQALFLPTDLPAPPGRVTPEQAADAVDDIADRIMECMSVVDACRAVLDVAITQREGGEAVLTGEAPTDRYSMNTLRNLLDDTELARQLVEWEASAYRDWARAIRAPAINNGRETVVEVIIRDATSGWIVVRQPRETEG